LQFKRDQPPSGEIFKFPVELGKGDELARFEGDRMPSESEFIAQLDVRRELGKVPPLEATAEQLKAAEAKAPPRTTEAAAPAAASAPAATTTYPPLEGRRP